MKIQNIPESLFEVVLQSYSLESFGRNLADFEHELVKRSSRGGIYVTIEECPRLLAGVFSGGFTLDAWIAAYAEELVEQFRLEEPAWVWAAERFLAVPFIQGSHSKRLKLWHTLKSPSSFSRRNLFGDFHLPPIALRRGRPVKSDAHKRMMNRQRVARFRGKAKTVS